MKNFKWIKCRWNTESAVKKSELGIDSEEYILKFAYVNMDKIAIIDEHEGMICLGFSAKGEDVLITNILFTKENIENLLKADD
ncbi:hypothetical protein [Tenacibaculum sp.]|uniref:hypothetical protein n=1 Tax=Tenacibaculum sp. TaxID=1906242 RepID=UPI003D0EFC7F